jgi:benzaldehyde dehydrogenase (NAD)
MERTQASLFDPAQRAGCIFSAGWRPGSRRTARVTDKADGQTLYDSGIADARDVDRAAAAAADAQRAWAATPPAARADVLRRFATCIEQHRGELANWIVRESGSFTGLRPPGAASARRLAAC